MEGNMVLIIVPAVLVVLLAAVLILRKRTAYLDPVKRELKKEKQWLRRGEYNAAMVKGRQNLELLLKLVADKNGIQLDNSAKAQANAREIEERQNQSGRGKQERYKRRKKDLSVMTHHQFYGWLAENGYLDRVARWEMNQVRIIGNKAVHENYSDKEDAWSQYNYLEDILKTITEKSQKPGKRQERKRSAEKEEEIGKSKQKSKRRRRKKKPAGENGQPKQVKENAPAQEKETKPQQEKKKPKPTQKPKQPQQSGKPAQKPKQPQQPGKQAQRPNDRISEQNAETAASKKRRRRRRRPSAPKTEGESGGRLAEERNEIS